MGAAGHSTARKMGILAALSTTGVIVLYGVVLVLGLLSLSSPDQPIGQPYFALMEVLILLMVPPLVVTMIAVGALAPDAQKPYATASVVFMAMMGCITSVVHFAIFVLRHQSTFANMPPQFLEFQWPSVVYALDILAWDVFFGLSVLFAAAAIRGSGLASWIRWLLIASGVLALLGLTGLITDDMQIRNIGILGYSGVFPVATLLIAVLFYRMPDDPETDPSFVR